MTKTIGIILVKGGAGRSILANTALPFAEATQTVKASNNRVFHAPEGYRRLTINLPEDSLKKLEIEKYVLIRDLINDALKTKKNWSESQWQQLMLSFILLLFPKYIKVLENVAIADYYSDTIKKTNRFIDIALLDANGNLDIIEVKKPFDEKILRKSPYRGNSVPTVTGKHAPFNTLRYSAFFRI